MYLGEDALINIGDDAPCGNGHAHPVDAESPVVAVAVQPRLYADALVRALQKTGCRIVRLDEDVPDASAESCEIVILSGDETPAPSPARVVIRLPENGIAADAAVITEAGEAFVSIDNLETIIELVEVHCQG
jgi:hypothetical protein